MIAFVENHHNFIFNTLPAFFHNKWVIMVLNLFFFYLLIKVSNFFIEKFVNKLTSYKDDFEYKKQIITLKSIVKSAVDTVIIIFAVMFVLNGLGLTPTQMVEGFAFLFAVDRIVDMFRTMLNITSDAVVTAVIADNENELNYDMLTNEESYKDII